MCLITHYSAYADLEWTRMAYDAFIAPSTTPFSCMGEN